jgi:hypothetical protein
VVQILLSTLFSNTFSLRSSLNVSVRNFVCVALLEALKEIYNIIVIITTIIFLQPAWFSLYSCKGKGKSKIHPRTGHEGPKRE